MHVRFPRAAVAADGVVAPYGSSNNPPRRDGRAAPVLWASRPLVVRAGRLVGVRQRDGEVYVALVAAGADALRWVKASTVLTEAQAAVWTRTSAFRR